MDAKELIQLTRYIGYVEGVLKAIINGGEVNDNSIANAVEELNNAQELIFKMAEK